MAEQIGLIKYKGNLGGLSGYTQDGKTLIRRAGGGSKEQFNNSDSMQRTRENASEFGRAASAGKLLRLALRQLVQNASDRYMVSRLAAKMNEVIKADEVNERGERGVLDGEVELVKGFDFNQNARLGSTVFAPIASTIDRADGKHTVAIPAMIPTRDIAAPRGTTHIKIVAGSAAIDFENEVFENMTAETAYIPYTNAAVAAQTLDLSLTTANSTHPIIVVVGIEFYQEVNSKQYALNNGAYNALAVTEVSGL